MAGEHFTVSTDHNSLHWLLNVLKPSGRLIRWCQRLSEFKFDIQYDKGVKNCLADALLRFRTDAEAVNATAELDIPMFDAHDAESPYLVHSEFEPNHQLLASQVEGSGDVVHSSIDLTTLVREQLTALFADKFEND